MHFRATWRVPLPRLLSKNTLLPLLSGGLLVFGFPNWNQEWIVWLWLLPLLVVVEEKIKRATLFLDHRCRRRELVLIS